MAFDIRFNIILSPKLFRLMDFSITPNNKFHNQNLSHQQSFLSDKSIQVLAA
jgi:hypothetical protein